MTVYGLPTRGIILLLIFVGHVAVASGDSDFDSVRYIKNYDGDTITFDIPDVHPLIGDEITVRLKGIDTAEKRTDDPCEKRVALKTQKVVEKILSKARRIDLLNSERGKYFRILADVYVDGESVAESLLQSGLAVSYFGGTKPKVDWCRR